MVFLIGQLGDLALSVLIALRMLVRILGYFDSSNE